MTTVWPTPGDTTDTWGTVLNNGLAVSLNTDGTLKITGSGANVGNVLLSNAAGAGGVQSDNNLWWQGGAGTSLLSLGAASGQLAQLVLRNGAAVEWAVENAPASSNAFVVVSATVNGLIVTQAGQLQFAQYGAGILGVGAGGAVSAYGAWTPYTPTIAAVSGTITYTLNAARYQVIGKTLWVSVDFTINTVTSGSNFTISLPASLTAASTAMVGFMRENVSTGKVVQLLATAGGGTVTGSFYDNTNPDVANYRFVGSFHTEVN